MDSHHDMIITGFQSETQFTFSLVGFFFVGPDIKSWKTFGLNLVGLSISATCLAVKSANGAWLLMVDGVAGLKGDTGVGKLLS